MAALLSQSVGGWSWFSRDETEVIMESYETEWNKKYWNTPQCPTCGESRVGKVNEKRERFGQEKELKCKDRFHVWFCGNNHSDRAGCHGHSRGYGRCMDQP